MSSGFGSLLYIRARLANFVSYFFSALAIQLTDNRNHIFDTCQSALAARNRRETQV